jgi:hypothetical protein
LLIAAPITATAGAMPWLPVAATSARATTWAAAFSNPPQSQNDVPAITIPTCRFRYEREKGRQA